MKKRVFSLMLALLMVFTMFPTSAIAVGTGTEQDPYQVGDTVTNDGTAEPEGATAENTHWERTDVPASQTTDCQMEAHDHVTAGCTAVYEAVQCLLDGHPEGETAFTHEDGTECAYDAENAVWLTNVAAGYDCGKENHAHTAEDCGLVEAAAYTLWTLVEDEAVPPPANNGLSEQDLDQNQSSRAAEVALPIHFFLASPGEIDDAMGYYYSYHIPSNEENEAWTKANIKEDPNWSKINTQNGIRNVAEESIITDYVASWPYNDREKFEQFGTVSIPFAGTFDDENYEIKWVSIMLRNNDLNTQAMSCRQTGHTGEHIHIDGLLVEKIQPGEMKVYKSIPAAQAADVSFNFTLQKMLQPDMDMTAPPVSADAVDTSFTPQTLTATISAGETEALITGGSEISFGYYKLTENDNAGWENDGITLTDSRGRTQTVDTDTLYICIAPNGSVLYSTNVSGNYTAMQKVAVRNARRDVTVTYQWRIYDQSGNFTEVLPGQLGNHNLPASATVKPGTDYAYNTGFVEGTSYTDYDTGLLYTFQGWDTYSNSSAFGVNPNVSGYHAVEGATIPVNADTWINGYWTVSALEPADAYIMVRKDVKVAGGDEDDLAYVKDYLENVKKMFIQIDPGIDKNDDNKSQVDVDYPGATTANGFKVGVYQYEKPFAFTEKQDDVPGYTRKAVVTVTANSNLKVTAQDPDNATATVSIDPEYAPNPNGYNLGTVTFTNTYTKQVGAPVSEFPVLNLYKRAANTGNLQSGATFTLYSDADCQNEKGSYTTDENGTLTINFTQAGTYYLKETAAPEGYLVNTTVYTLKVVASAAVEELRDGKWVEVTPHTLTIEAPGEPEPGATTAAPVQIANGVKRFDLNVYNEPILGQLTVKKEAKSLAEGDKDKLTATLTVHGPITRDAQNKITALGREYTLILDKNNEWTTTQARLPIGEYLIHENMASVHGYTWDNDATEYTYTNNTDSQEKLKTEEYNNITSGVFEVKAGSTDIQVTVTNTYEPWASADFYIYKTDPNGAHLGGATFQLYSDPSCDPNTALSNSSFTTSATTSANGYAWFHGYTVPTDDSDDIVTYYLKETAAPAGHYLSGTIYKVDITAVPGANGAPTTYEPRIYVKSEEGNWVDSSDFDKTSDLLTIENAPVTGSLTIKKEMVGAPETLNSITVYVSGPNHFGQTVTLTRAKEWTETLERLPLGEYTIIEQNATAPGYDLVTKYIVDDQETSDKATVTLTEENPGETTIDDVITGTATVKNTYTMRKNIIENPTTLTVMKVGEDGQTALAGAKFKLTRGSDSATLVTGEDGMATFDFLSGTIGDDDTSIDGKYILEEIEAPVNHVKSDTKWEVTVKTRDGDPVITLNAQTNFWDHIWNWIIGGATADGVPYEIKDNTLTVVNESIKGDLTIRKNVTILEEDKDYAEGKTYKVKLDCSDDRFDQTIEMTHDQTVTIKDIPYGTTYTVTEDTTGAGFTYRIRNHDDDNVINTPTTSLEVLNDYKVVENNPGINLIKVDAVTGEPVEGAVFYLYFDEACTNYANSGISDANGKVSIPVLSYAYDTYYLKEYQPADGYYPNETVYTVHAKTEYVVRNEGADNAYLEKQQTITIDDLGEPTVAADNAVSYTYTVENRPILPVTITATKEWNDGGYYARPDEVTVVLSMDGEEFDYKTLSEENDWTYTWSGPEFTDQHEWTVDEPIDYVPTGYSKSVTNDGNDWTITNTRAPKTVDISVTKAWNHNGGKNLPESIKVTLYKDGKAYETVTLNDANDWSYKWTGLTDVYQWSIDETEVPAGYVKDIKIDGYKFTVTNTRTINPVEVSVAKAWVASEGVILPESIEVVLYRDGEKFDTVKLTEKNNWEYTWEDLTDEYTWSVDEPEVPAGYTKNVTANGNSFTITNTQTKNETNTNTNNQTTIPNTGDDTNLTMLVLLCAIGLIGILITAYLLFVPRKKGKYLK